VTCLNGRGLVPNTYAFTMRVTDSVGNFATGAFTPVLGESKLFFTRLALPGQLTPDNVTILGPSGDAVYRIAA